MENLNYILSLNPAAKIKYVKKGEFLLREGENSTQAFFVKMGLLRSYTIDEKGKEHIFMFATQGWIIADIESQEFNQPAKLFIDCIEDSDVIAFNRNLFSKLELSKYQLTKNLNLLARRAAVLQRRVLMLMSSTAKERYEFFLETYPELPDRVPQRMIASYLGITPEALSKIRGKMVKSE
tara:strand:+ start:116 stop:655 length:540 start_codon:yes stop_codon:yes gene_type:complete